VLTKTKIAICVAMVVGATTAGFAKDRNAPPDRAHAAANSSSRHALGQAPIVQPGKCWVPARDQSDDEYGADTRGLGYWGSCGEKGAVPSK
jgi:hypothetical protein